MDFENKAPKWDAEGTEPSSDLQTKGFVAGYKPPATYFNYLFNKISKCITELQNKLSGTDKAASDHMNTHKMQTYTGLSQIGLTIGSETIDGIISALPDNATLLYDVGSTNAAIYPYTYGTMHVTKRYSTRAILEFYYKGYNKRWYSVYDSTMETPWSGWTQVVFAENGIVPISAGGTGSADRKEAIENLVYFGLNPIASAENDTVENWREMGTGYAFYTTEGCITDQPNRYGFLINFVADKDIFQMWKIQSVGAIFVRSGNASGWSDTWAKMYDSLNKPTAAEIGAAAAKHAANHAEGGSDPITPYDIGAIPSYVGMINGTDYTFNTALALGEYEVNAEGAEGAPYTGHIYGKLVCKLSTGNEKNAKNWLWQEFYPTVETQRRCWRMKVNELEWTEWHEIYDSVKPPTINDILTSALSLAKGGTGGTNRVDAFKNIGFIGVNPITTPEEDTVENWVALGSGYAWFSTGGQLTNQPSSYGLVLNYAPNAYEITQIWKSHSSGVMAVRSGNASGWGETWQILLRRSDIVDNLVSTATNLPLSAKQGNVLSEQISELNTKISSMYLERTTVTLTGESHAIEAPSIDGRRFVCWVSASTREWVGSVYIENPSQTSTNVWKSVGAGGIVDCYALYRNS